MVYDRVFLLGKVTHIFARVSAGHMHNCVGFKRALYNTHTFTSTLHCILTLYILVTFKCVFLQTLKTLIKYR